MNTTAHTVSPEELMAFLDGELSGSAAESVAAHLAECEECAGIVTQFRNTSQSLSLWTVPAPPDEMESAIKEVAADAAYNHRYMRQYRWSRERSGG
jgi:anti-sigma factor RsiW